MQKIFQYQIRKKTNLIELALGCSATGANTAATLPGGDRETLDAAVNGPPSRSTVSFAATGVDAQSSAAAGAALALLGRESPAAAAEGAAAVMNAAVAASSAVGTATIAGSLRNLPRRQASKF